MISGRRTAQSAALILLLTLVPGAMAGITFEPYNTQSGIQVTTDGHIFGFGAAVSDIDNDGDLDLYVTDGPGRANRLFRNEGGFFFAQIPDAAGAGHLGNSKGSAFADYDNDGDKDLFVANYDGACVLYRNDGGTFSDVSAFAGILADTLRSTGVCWGDIDNDGYLDLYVGSRGESDDQTEPNLFYHNQGDGTFVESGAVYRLDSHAMTFQPVFSDYDRDGDLDLYCASDRFTLNRLFRNDGIIFSDVSALEGAALSMDGMGNAIGDVNADGFPDFYVTNTPGGNKLIVSQPGGGFLEMSDSLGIAVNEIGWGAFFFDADQDGDEDLLEVNMQAMPNFLFRNDGAGLPFADVSLAAGIGGTGISYGCACADMDNDGDLDLYISNRGSTCEVYRNTTPNAGHWIQILPEGTVSNRDGIGTRIEVEAGGSTQFREIRAGSSYLSQMQGRAHFGLGAETGIDRLTVRWPSGIVNEWFNISADQMVTVVEQSPTGISDTSPARPAPISLLASPNPFRHSVTFHARLPESTGAISAEIYDIGGRLVRRLSIDPTPRSLRQIRWDRLDRQGNAVSAGTYFLRLRAGRHVVTSKVIAIR